MAWPRIKRGQREGDRPVGVFIVNMMTGEKMPVELSYRGLDNEGLHLWVMSTPIDPDIEKITVEVMPPRTAIGFHAQMSGNPDATNEKGEGK